MTTPTQKKTSNQASTKRKPGRPISQYTPLEKHKMSLEEEAKVFYEEKVAQEVEKLKDAIPVTAHNLYAASALSGLISSGRYSRAEELVEEAFKYADLMTRFKQ